MVWPVCAKGHSGQDRRADCRSDRRCDGSPSGPTRFGPVRACVWQNHDGERVWYQVTVNRLYKGQDNQWHSTDSFGYAHLLLAQKGWDPAYGARPLKRVIQKAVQDPLAELILAGSVKDGDSVAVSAGKQGLERSGCVK